MAETGCDEQVGAVALSWKGEETEALLPGLLTVMPPVVEALVLTVTATSVTHAAPALPQALTWRVWLPLEAETVASMEVLCTTVVLELLSSEKPMALTGWFEQLAETALRVNCVDTWALLVGL